MNILEVTHAHGNSSFYNDLQRNRIYILREFIDDFFSFELFEMISNNLLIKVGIPVTTVDCNNLRLCIKANNNLSESNLVLLYLDKKFDIIGED